MPWDVPSVIGLFVFGISLFYKLCLVGIVAKLVFFLLGFGFFFCLFLGLVAQWLVVGNFLQDFGLVVQIGEVEVGIGPVGLRVLDDVAQAVGRQRRCRPFKSGLVLV